MSDQDNPWPPPEEPTPTSPVRPPPSPHEPRWKPLHILIFILVLGAVFAGGLFGTRAYQENQREKAEAAAAAEKAAEKQAAEEEFQQQVADCEDALDDYVDALQVIDSRLNVGLNQGELSDLAGQAAVEQGQLDDVPEGFCEEAQESADEAMSIYASTASEWNDCIFDDNCDPDDLDLSSDWTLASDALKEAKDLMNGRDSEADT